MNKFCKKIEAFTMAEVMIVMVIIAIVSLATYGVMKAQTNYATKYQYYAAIMNLKQATGEVIADGYTLAGTLHKEIPPIASKATADATNPEGFCNKLTDIMNIIPDIGGNPPSTTCGYTASPTNFSAADPNFVTTNGQKYFFNTTTPPYTIYIDINGTRGNSVSNGTTPDVQPFIVNSDGTVFPHPTSLGATSLNYLAASVQYRDASGHIVVVERGVTYYQAVCDANPPGASPILYNTTTCSRSAAAGNCATNICEVIINKPGF